MPASRLQSFIRPRKFIGGSFKGACYSQLCVSSRETDHKKQNETEYKKYALLLTIYTTLTRLLLQPLMGALAGYTT